MEQYAMRRPVRRARQRSMLGRWWAPGDILVVAAVAALSVLLIFNGMAGAGGGKLKAAISVNGKVVREIELAQERRELTIRGYQGDSSVEMEGMRVRMADSACPDKLCVRSGWISRPGASIVCLPNRVVIEIKSGTGGPDVVNR